MSKIIYKMSKVLAAIALLVTTCNVNSACVLWMYQPELPEGAESLRK